MKLSTRIKRDIWPGYINSFDDSTKLPIVFMVDFERRADTTSLNLADKFHKSLLDEGCTLLPKNECPVVNSREIIMHYTSTTYKEWCEAPHKKFSN